MITVDQSKYKKVVAFIREANNYQGMGHHNIDGETHYISRNGSSVCAARIVGPDFAGEGDLYQIEESVYKKYKEIHGYNI